MGKAQFSIPDNRLAGYLERYQRTVDDENLGVVLGDLRACWHMNEAVWAGGGAYDVIDSAGGNNGTAKNGANTIAGGKLNRCGDFDGVNDHVEIPHSANLSFPRGSSFSLAAWVYPDVALGSIYNKGSSGWSNYGLFYHSTAQFWFYADTVGGTRASVFSAVSPVSNWYHVVCVMDGVDMSMYVNGVLQNERNRVAVGTINNANAIRMGVASDGISYPFNGKIDEVCVWGWALGKRQVDYLYNAGAGREII